MRSSLLVTVGHSRALYHHRLAVASTVRIGSIATQNGLQITKYNKNYHIGYVSLDLYGHFCQFLKYTDLFGGNSALTSKHLELFAYYNALPVSPFQ